MLHLSNTSCTTTPNHPIFNIYPFLIIPLYKKNYAFKYQPPLTHRTSSKPSSLSHSSCRWYMYRKEILRTQYWKKKKIMDSFFYILLHHLYYKTKPHQKKITTRSFSLCYKFFSFSWREVENLTIEMLTRGWLCEKKIKNEDLQKSELKRKKISSRPFFDFLLPWFKRNTTITSHPSQCTFEQSEMCRVLQATTLYIQKAFLF